MVKKQKECSDCGETKLLDEFDLHRNRCIVCRKKLRKRYEEYNKDALQKYQAEYYKKHSEKKKLDRKKYVENNRGKINKAERNKKKRDPNFKIACNLRSRLRSVIKRNQKIGSAVKDLGCSVSELKIYLEKQFYLHPKTKLKMTWENYGLFGWQIDHIKPFCSFDLTNKKQFLEACHYTNLQPLWAEDHDIKTIKDIKILRRENV